MFFYGGSGLSKDSSRVPTEIYSLDDYLSRENEDLLEFSVSDSGMGIKSKDQASLF